MATDFELCISYQHGVKVGITVKDPGVGVIRKPGLEREGLGRTFQYIIIL